MEVKNSKFMKKIFVHAFLVFLILSFAPSSFAQTNEELVVLHTNSGKIVIEFFPDVAPKHVDNFLNLTENGFYDNTLFHRIIKDFMIQGGDPNTKLGQETPQSQWGTGNPGHAVDAEFNDIKHNRGIVSMARSASPNSAGSQFFIVHQNSNFLDNQYTVFGRIVTQESFDTLDAIASLQTGASDIPSDFEKSRIIKTEIINRSEPTNLLELGEPEKTSPMIPAPADSQNATYTNEDLGISFVVPEGWILQEPQKTSPDVPDIVAVGPKLGEINPVISLNIVFTNGKTLDERVEEIRNNLKPGIASGKIEIISEGKTNVNKLEAHLKTVVGEFESNNIPVKIKFREALIATPEKFYTLTFNIEEKDFDSNVIHFENALNSFTILGYEPEKDTVNQTEGGGCLIATATYGSELAPQVQQLRELRDNSLVKTKIGLGFMSGFNQIYYFISPTIADMERQNPAFKEFVKITITPLVASLSLLNHVEFDSEEQVLGYGTGLILLNSVIYLGIPAIAIVKLRTRIRTLNFS